MAIPIAIRTGDAVYISVVSTNLSGRCTCIQSLTLFNFDVSHTGTIKGTEYFKCAPNRGLMVPLSDVFKI